MEMDGWMDEGLGFGGREGWWWWFFFLSELRDGFLLVFFLFSFKERRDYRRVWSVFAL